MSYGIQPARAALRAERWSITAAAKEMNVDRKHLDNVVFGYARPNWAVRERLPKLVNRPLEELFTAEALTRPYARTGR